MFDVIETSERRQLAGKGNWEFTHKNPADCSLFEELGSVRRVPIEARRSFTDALGQEYSEPEPLPNFSALMNTATGEILDTRPIGKTYNLWPHDTLFRTQANKLAQSSLPQGDLTVVDRIYDNGLRAHRTVYFNDLQTTVKNGADNVRCRMDVFNSIDMSWAFQIFSGAYRDLCRNTLVFGGQKAYHQKRKHTANLSPEALMGKAEMGLDMWTSNRDQMTKWAETPLAPENFAQILSETVCRKAGKAAELGHANPVNERRMNYLLHRFNEERDELGRTLWAGYNALTHWATHTNETWTGEDGVERQTGKKTGTVHMVQRQRNDKVRDVLTSDAWTRLEGIAA